MPDESQNYGSESSRREPPRSSSSAGSRQPDHARRREPPHPPTLDGRGSESEMDSEINYFHDTTSPIPLSGGHDGNAAAHRGSMMEPTSTAYSTTSYIVGYDLNSTGAVSYMGTDPSGSTLRLPSSHQRVDSLLPYEPSSGSIHFRAWGGSATDGADIYADPPFTVGGEAAPTDASQGTSASTVDDQYASSGTQDLRANSNNGEAGLYIADHRGYPAFWAVRYPSPELYVGDEDPVPTDATAGEDINQPAQIMAVHSPPSSIDANMGSAQVSPVAQQQARFERGPEVADIMDEAPHWAGGEGPWNSYDAAWRHHYYE
ncbi:hypothetical protein DL765_001526 [Monosporascus sp. GIB2]|nr:hypothetical protein DL765_001526 [Monosporascus sp. GIB2]